MRRKSTLQALRDLGFDQSEHVPFQHLWRAKCSQCVAAVINGIPTHEHGCPNQPKNEEEQQ